MKKLDFQIGCYDSFVEARPPENNSIYTIYFDYRQGDHYVEYDEHVEDFKAFILCRGSLLDCILKSNEHYNDKS